MRKEVTVATYGGNVPNNYWTKDEFTILVSKWIAAHYLRFIFTIKIW